MYEFGGVRMLFFNRVIHIFFAWGMCEITVKVEIGIAGKRRLITIVINIGNTTFCANRKN